MLRSIVSGLLIFCFSFESIFAQEQQNAVVYIYVTRGNNQAFGTGFFVDQAGTFVTAYHVVFDAAKIDVYNSKSVKFSNVQLISADPINDLAVLTINNSTPNFLRVEDQIPTLNLSFSSVGHPRGFKYQTLQGRITQNGFADSMQLLTARSAAIFTKSIPIIPLDLTIYGGMSGAPIITAEGAVIGMLSGSFSEGGALAWGIPAKQILALTRSLPSTRTNLSNVVWRPMDSMSSAFRSYSIPKNLSVSETVEWLNAKWQERGVREFDVNGFTAHVDEARAVFDGSSRALELTVAYNLTGDNYRTRVRISLDDALRASMRSSTRIGSWYYPVVECPIERSCVFVERQRLASGGWRTLQSQRTNRVAADNWAMVDQDGAARVATAINHLIQLHGGPVSRQEPFSASSQ